MSETGKIRIPLGDVQETLLMPLWARAKEMEKPNPIVRDDFADYLVRRLDYDFSTIANGQVAKHQSTYAIRAYNFDQIIHAFLAGNTDVLVVNIGAGLDTAFQRVDNGSVFWVNLDLPDVAALRRKLIPDSRREITTARSVFDFAWLDDIARFAAGRSVMFMAAGVFCYFESSDMERLFGKLACVHPSAEVVFDSFSRFSAWGINRCIMKDSGMDPSARIRWHLKRASKLKRWVKTLKVLDEYPLLSNFPKDSHLGKGMKYKLRITGLFRFYNMIHVKL